MSICWALYEHTHFGLEGKSGRMKNPARARTIVTIPSTIYSVSVRSMRKFVRTNIHLQPARPPCPLRFL